MNSKISLAACLRYVGIATPIKHPLITNDAAKYARIQTAIDKYVSVQRSAGRL